MGKCGACRQVFEVDSRECPRLKKLRGLVHRQFDKTGLPFTAAP